MSRIVYVGAYTRADYHGKGEGISVYQTDTDTGALTHTQTVTDGENPSFLTMHPNHRYLYAVNETPDGGVSAFGVEPGTGHLTFLNAQPSLGADPCHLCVDPTGHFVVVANYTSGSIAVLPIAPDGMLGRVAEKVQHTGSGPNATRQTGPHMHMVGFSPDARYLLAADLGIDQIIVYRLDPATGKLLVHEGDGVHPVARLSDGAGPRHYVFRPDGKFFYLINELASTIVACRYDAASGALTPVQTVSTLPPGYANVNTTAELVIAPSGRFVYGSNRGCDTIAVFATDATTGQLTALDFTPSGGRTPRCFAIDPEGTHLYAANQDSDTLVAFHVAPDSGRLTPTSQVIPTPTPVCVLIEDV